jgi:hypothetical protein
MTSASERQVNHFAKEFQFVAQSGLSCFHNGLHALIRVYEKTSIVPKIYQVDTPELGFHAYLVHENVVYNRGVTWTTDAYPNYSLEQLKLIGEDKTEVLLSSVLLAVENGDDSMGFVTLGKIIEAKLPGYQNTALKYFEQTKKTLNRSDYYYNLLLVSTLKARGMSSEEVLRFFGGGDSMDTE